MTRTETLMLCNQVAIMIALSALCKDDPKLQIHRQTLLAGCAATKEHVEKAEAEAEAEADG